MVLSILDALLLFAFSIPVVMQYRILPIPGTPYWLFGILFFILGAHCFISMYPEVLGVFRKHLAALKLICTIATITIALGGAMGTAIVDRARTAPVLGVHDIILQQEAAMRYVITGKNPYKETYFGTPVESFHYAELGEDAVNPALYHFVMPPWYLIFPFLFYFPSVHFLNLFDGRMALLFTMVLLLVALWYWYKDKAIARLAIVATALSPSVVNYFVEGRSDVFALAWLMVSVVFLGKRNYFWSAVFLALAILSKQTIWFAVPFLGVYLWKETMEKPRVFWMTAFTVAAVSLVFVLPFVMWDIRAFFESVVLYLTGNTAHSYPVSGYGLGMMLYDAGIIRDIHAYYPFIVWQVIIAVPLLIVLLRWLWMKPTGSRLMVGYAVFLLVYWYLSRYFNNSHLGYISMLFVIGGLKLADEVHT